jgi:hypothetical protein
VSINVIAGSAATKQSNPNAIIPGWCVSARPGISGFRVRRFAPPRNDGFFQLTAVRFGSTISNIRGNSSISVINSPSRIGLPLTLILPAPTASGIGTSRRKSKLTEHR